MNGAGRYPKRGTGPCITPRRETFAARPIVTALIDDLIDDLVHGLVDGLVHELVQIAPSLCDSPDPAMTHRRRLYTPIRHRYSLPLRVYKRHHNNNIPARPMPAPCATMTGAN